MRLKKNSGRREFLCIKLMTLSSSQVKPILLLACFSALFILHGCRYRYGTAVESFPPARSPKGVTGSIVTIHGTYSAELIEVRDTGIVILAAGKFRYLPYSGITSSHFDGISGSTISSRATPSSTVRNRLSLVSRFPQRLTPELLQELLSANGQSELTQDNP